MEKRAKYSIGILTILFVFLNSCQEYYEYPEINNPPFISDQEFYITENSPKNSVVDTVVATDIDFGDKLKFSILHGDINEAFSIDSITGVISVNDSTQIDYEVTTKFELAIKVIDKQGLISLAKITIHVIDEVSIINHYILSLQPDSIDGKDAMLWTGLPDRVVSNYTSLSAVAWTWSAVGFGSGVIRSLLEFDLTEIPISAVVDSAFLSLYNDPNSTANQGEHSSRSGSNVSVLQRITENWDENTVTWNNQPLTTNINEIVLKESTDIHQDYVDMNITQHVQEMVQYPSTNHGFMLKLVTEEYYRAMIFASSDHPNQNIRPKLEIYYTIEENR